MAFWWHREHLKLVGPVVLPLVVPGLAVTQVACVVIAWVLGLHGAEAFWVTAAAGASGALLVGLLSLGVLERYIRRRCARRQAAIATTASGEGTGT